MDHEISESQGTIVELPAGTVVADHPPDASPQPASDAAATRTSPAEAFKLLRESIDRLADRVDGVEGFARLCKDKLLRQADEYRSEGLLPALESLFQLHDIAFRHLQAIEGGAARPDPFILNFFQTIEAELSLHRVDVIRPAPGDEPDLTLMKTIGSDPCPFWRKADRIARVHSCGYVLDTGGVRRTLRKAEISVYRK